ncbi:flagellar basal body-associated FliL family protein [Solimonas terrae]|uniref:Flagellar protein FliL n=1 Tax=Solimonas terrae TaxID=1396819 RepID=A0A6M2BXK3_9GAMM|nr:flagellar basal body-associated FliL family protein [Solimonas terrae]NGY06911.1 flagellar basal body protein FliL [Solimonas terrae]
MASAATANDEDPAKPAAKAKKGGSPMLAIIIAVVLSTGASAGISFMLVRHALDAAAHKADAAADGEGDGGKADAAKPRDPPNYVPLDPAFVVNLEADDTRFLQVQVQLMTRDAHAVDTLKLHEPLIRNALLMLFSQQHPADVATLAGKEKLQADALAEIQRILTQETGKPQIEAVYFTSFVMQ